MCSAVISARFRMRLAAKLRRRCSCPTFFCLCTSLSAAAPPAYIYNLRVPGEEQETKTCLPLSADLSER